ncbi:hypothetical protein SH449x_005196 [Pirellulaceae bacterium SH449]
MSWHRSSASKRHSSISHCGATFCLQSNRTASKRQFWQGVEPYAMSPSREQSADDIGIVLPPVFVKASDS